MATRSRLHPMRWPRWAWYAAAVVWATALAAAVGGIYQAVHGDGFWTVFLIGAVGGTAVQAVRLLLQGRRRGAKETGPRSAT